MSEEKIKKINQAGKISKIIAKIILVCMIISAVATGGLAIASMCVPNDIATVTIDATANIQIDEKYLDIGKMILSEVNEGMTEEGQVLDIAGSEYEYVSADIDGEQININYNALDNKLGVRNLARLFAGMFLESVNCLVLMIFVLSLCNEVSRCRTPFEESVIDKMKRLAFALIPFCFIDALAQNISSTAFTSFSLDGSFNISVLIVVLVILALVYIFKYGAELQQQSDETL